MIVDPLILIQSDGGIVIDNQSFLNPGPFCSPYMPSSVRDA